MIQQHLMLHRLLHHKHHLHLLPLMHIRQLLKQHLMQHQLMKHSDFEIFAYTQQQTQDLDLLPYQLQTASFACHIQYQAFLMPRNLDSLTHANIHHMTYCQLYDENESFQLQPLECLAIGHALGLQTYHKSGPCHTQLWSCTMSCQTHLRTSPSQTFPIYRHLE